MQLTHPRDAMGCTFCHACAAVCPTHALKTGHMVEDNGPHDRAVRLELAVDPSRCLGCGRCAEVCVDDLLTLGRGPSSRHRARAGGLIVLAQGRRSTCDACGQPLAPNEQGTCGRCVSARALVADVLAR